MGEVAPADVVHVDDHVLVVNKPAGVLMTPAHGAEGLVDQLDRVFVGRRRLAVVHRLDLLTSGLVVLARDTASAAALAKQFAAHRVERIYTAIVCGRVIPDAGTWAARLDDQRAVTHFSVLQRGEDVTTVQVRLETGRRNQIRLHFAAAGHPLLGDTRLGGDAAKHAAWPWSRIALHAGVLGFVHPKTGRVMRYAAPLPSEFEPFAP